MLDLKLIRENPEKVKQGIANKNEKDRVDEILELDKHRRELIAQSEELKAKRNQVSAEIPKLKKAGQDVTEILAEMKKVSDSITELDVKLREVENQLNEILMYIPNLPHESVPVGKSSEENIEVRQWLPEGFSFEWENGKPLDHIELGRKLNILDFERGAKVSGSGFPVY
ncbi:MAG: serine--tRNA ligase, partial [Ignavibacterium sp.]